MINWILLQLYKLDVKLGIWLRKRGWEEPRRVRLDTSDGAGLSGRYTIIHRRGGVEIDRREVKNLVVNAGLAGVASRICGAGSEAVFDYVAVGTGTTAAAAGDTALETEITDSGLARAQDASTTRETTTVTNDTAVINYLWNVTGTKAVTEAAVFNAAVAGTIIGRSVFAALNVANGDTLEIIYKFQLSAT